MFRPLLANALFGLALMTGPALAADVRIGSLTISSAWARATPPGAPTGGGYLTIVNHGATPDVLLAAATPDAASTELHSMTMVNGVAQMRAITDGVPIPAGGSITFDPNGMHVMFVQLSHQLEQGGTVPVTLVFKNAGQVTIDMPILAIGSMGPAGSSGAAMPHLPGNGGMESSSGASP
ncbi:MAG TPA: copper chaperone PCu(A)C [Bauldia sp.]|nr:copper chaperone PCu(A)C [Bauldia sp.]